ncbi:purine and uridine phosphorylase [Aureobasidium subglaciale]|nr:purine and uridine phosphorylase [Aureobasidium subglaciale]
MGFALEDYQVGWLCALPIEVDLAELMLDGIHHPVRLPVQDQNIYTFGHIIVNDQKDFHNVVIARLPAAETGKVAAATVAKDMLRTFTNLRFGLMVGIAGGIWTPENDIRLGDVVVGVRDDNGPGIVQYDHGKYIQEKEFIHRGVLDRAPKMLRTAVSVMKQVRKGHEFLKHLEVDKVTKIAPRPTADTLFAAEYVHTDGLRSCTSCSLDRSVERPERETTAPVVHYGAIASGDGVVKDALFAKEIQQKHGVLCFEMEAAGLDNFPCLVIRGISDYADTHKNDDWHAYAASTAAAYAKQLLTVVPLTPVTGLPSIAATSVTTPSALRVNQHWIIPRQSSNLFTGREELLRDMKIFLLPTSEAPSRRPTYVLYGIGGAGKSETTIKFAEENRNSFWGIFWINADSRASAEQGFADISSTFGLSGTDIASVKSWFSGLEESWLLVLDNCDDEALNLSDLCPSGQFGSMIITTRLPDCCDYGKPQNIDELGQQPSTELLLKACGISPDDAARKDAMEVVDLVGQLAIALVHAGAYIRKGYCTLQRYPAVFQDRHERECAMEFNLKQMSSTHGSVYTTFEISAAAIANSEDGNLALTLLRLLAFLDRKGVPEDLFTRAADRCLQLEQDPQAPPDLEYHHRQDNTSCSMTIPSTIELRYA